MTQEKAALTDYFNTKQKEFYLELAKDYLNYLGIPAPSNRQLEEFQCLLSEVSVKRYIGIDNRLSVDEAKTLYFSAFGKTTKQIARVLKVTPRQIERHRTHIFKKLGCRNIAEAVAKGIRFLEINPWLDEGGEETTKEE